MRIVLHVGLHKTASTYLQGRFFPRLGGSVVYNPDDIFYFVNAIFTLGIREARFIEEAARLASAYARKDDGRTLLLSSEAMLQTSFDMNFQSRADLLAAIFPSAEVVVFLRNQLDWLESSYRESIKHHFYQDIGEFLGYRNGEFENPPDMLDSPPMWRINVWKCDWANLLLALRRAFDPGRVHRFFYEEFRQAPDAVLAALSRIVGCRAPETDSGVRVNRGLSAGAIAALVAYARVLNRAGLRYPTYTRKFSIEKAQVLANPFHWKPPPRGPVRRLMRGLVMEPYRLLRRLDPVRVITLLDRRFSRHPGGILHGEMRDRLQDIYCRYNAAMESEFDSAAVAAQYRFACKR